METWKTGYLRQAQSDMKMYDVLMGMNRSGCPICHPFHYLQMATEKLAKAFLIDPKRQADPKFSSHKVFTKFLQALRGYRVPEYDVISQKMRMDKRQFVSHIDSLLGSAKVIEDLIPTREPQTKETKKENPEYPWKPVGGAVEVPAEYKRWLLNPASSEVRQLLWLVRVCMNVAAQQHMRD